MLEINERIYFGSKKPNSMTELSFSFKAPISQNILFKLITDFENLPSYMPVQLKKVEIIEKNNAYTITEETFLLKTIFKKEIKQKSSHEIISSNEMQTKITNGPAKGTLVQITLKEEEGETRINIKTSLKLGFKYKIFIPIVKKYYSPIFTGILYKMINSTMNDV